MNEMSNRMRQSQQDNGQSTNVNQKQKYGQRSTYIKYRFEPSANINTRKIHDKEQELYEEYCQMER